MSRRLTLQANARVLFRFGKYDEPAAKCRRPDVAGIFLAAPGGARLHEQNHSKTPPSAIDRAWPNSVPHGRADRDTSGPHGGAQLGSATPRYLSGGCDLLLRRLDSR